jgi:uncharacterized protein YbjT (DUF2867 family)
MILVTGATGTVGSDVVRLLAEAKTPVRAMTRDPGKAKVPAGVEVVKGDFDDVASLEAATKGATKMFLLALGPKLFEMEARALAAAKKNGVKHVVKISTLGAGQPNNAIATWHRTGEQQLEASGLMWSFMRPSGFMSNALSWVGSIKKASSVFGGIGEVKSAPIHPRDIAASSVAALVGTGHENKAYHLTGGELLSMQDQCDVLGKELGKDIRYVTLPDDKLRESLLAAGRPPGLVEGIIALQKAIRESGGSHKTDDVQALTGRNPLTWAQWCQEHVAAFR